MNRKKLVASVAAAAVVLAFGVGGVAYATGDDSSQQATGSDIEKAKNAALDYTDGGRVTGTEIGDKEGYYEIEITRDDGSRVDVHLDRDLDVLGKLADHEGPDDKDAPKDD